MSLIDALTEGRQVAVVLPVIEGVQAVCVLDAASTMSSSASDKDAVLDQLAQLLDKSLVQSQQGSGGEPRFSMLETIHEYATEQLVASGETAAQRRHADYFLQLVRKWMQRPSRRDRRQDRR